jgi:hypothetical protein
MVGVTGDSFSSTARRRVPSDGSLPVSEVLNISW